MTPPDLRKPWVFGIILPDRPADLAPIEQPRRPTVMERLRAWLVNRSEFIESGAVGIGYALIGIVLLLIT